MANPNQPLNRPRINPVAAAALAALGPTAFPNGREVLDYSFFDRKSWATATAQEQTYFAAPGTDVLTSNFVGSGSMPANQAFLISGLRIVINPATSMADVISIMRNMSLVLTLENAKKYAEGPAWMFPAGVGPQAETQVPVTAAASPGTVTGNQGVPSLGNTYRFSNPVLLRPQQPFAVKLASVSGLTLATSPALVYVVMDGLLVRGVL